MRRAVITTIAVACAAAAAGPVLASPPVDAGRAAAVSVSTTLANGDSLTLDLTAAELSSGTQLIVDATECDDNACAADVYTGALRADELTIDPSADIARLTTTLAGRSLDISWRPSHDSGYTTGPGTTVGNGSGFFGSDSVGSMADASVGFDGFSCTGSGGVGTAVTAGASTDSSSETEPLSALALPSSARLTCVS